MSTAEASLDTVAGPIDILGTDHIELYVGNARQAASYYQQAFGFDVVAYAGPETGERDRAARGNL